MCVLQKKFPPVNLLKLVYFFQINKMQSFNIFKIENASFNSDHNRTEEDAGIIIDDDEKLADHSIEQGLFKTYDLLKSNSR
jgi:hypothetical protein